MMSQTARTVNSLVKSEPRRPQVPDGMADAGRMCPDRLADIVVIRSCGSWFFSYIARGMTRALSEARERDTQWKCC